MFPMDNKPLFLAHTSHEQEKGLIILVKSGHNHILNLWFGWTCTRKVAAWKCTFIFECRRWAFWFVWIHDVNGIIEYTGLVLSIRYKKPHETTIRLMLQLLTQQPRSS